MAKGFKSGLVASFSDREKDARRYAIPTGVYQDTNMATFIGMFGAMP